MEVLIPGPFAQLVTQPAELAAVEATFQRVILGSFGDDVRESGGTPILTQAEVRRRFGICEKWFRICRAELHWSVQRALEQLGVLLRAELNGAPIDPSKLGQVWIAPESEREMVYDRDGPDYNDGTATEE